MFEVFDQADKTVSSSAIPKGQAGSTFVAKTQVGSSAPFGFFDPAGFSNDVTEEQFKLYQEAEIKHGYYHCYHHHFYQFLFCNHLLIRESYFSFYLKSCCYACFLRTSCW